MADAEPMNVVVFCARYGIPISVLNEWCRDPSKAASQGWRVEDDGASVILEPLRCDHKSATTKKIR